MPTPMPTPHRVMPVHAAEPVPVVTRAAPALRPKATGRPGLAHTGLDLELLLLVAVFALALGTVALIGTRSSR